MNVLTHRPTLRWSVPLVAAAVLGAGGSAIGVITATARDGLPQRTASQLLVDVQKARLDGLSGTVVQHADLGLPSLPGIGGGGSSDPMSLVSGSHTLRVWYAGPNRVRLALLGSLGESDLVRNGKDLWMWSSAEKSATHRSIPLAGDAPESLASVSPLTPQKAAEAALEAISPSTKVSTDGTAVVAGRSAYELLLQPRDARSLVSSVRIAVDGKTHIPTRVRVFADGADKPAFEVGFTSFDPTSPPASVFRFNPPPGTKVTEDAAEPSDAPQSSSSSRRLPEALMSGPEPTIVGTGWTSVLVAKVPSAAGSGEGSGQGSGQGSGEGSGEGSGGPGELASLLKALPKVSGSWGSGHLLQGELFSALLTDDGQFVVGPVPPSMLYAALDR